MILSHFILAHIFKVIVREMSCGQQLFHRTCNVNGIQSCITGTGNCKIALASGNVSLHGCSKQ